MGTVLVLPGRGARLPLPEQHRRGLGGAGSTSSTATEVREPAAAPIFDLRRTSTSGGRWTSGRGGSTTRKASGGCGRRGGGRIRRRKNRQRRRPCRGSCGWEAAVRVSNPNCPSYMQPTGPLADGPRLGQATAPAAGPCGKAGLFTGCASRGLPGPAGQARPHGPDGQAAATACRQPRGPWRCQPPRPGHEAMNPGPVALFLLFYFI
jgi:hypothetical protein